MGIIYILSIFYNCDMKNFNYLCTQLDRKNV